MNFDIKVWWGGNKNMLQTNVSVMKQKWRSFTSSSLYCFENSRSRDETGSGSDPESFPMFSQLLVHKRFKPNTVFSSVSLLPVSSRWRPSAHLQRRRGTDPPSSHRHWGEKFLETESQRWRSLTQPMTARSFSGRKKMKVYVLWGPGVLGFYLGSPDNRLIITDYISVIIGYEQ